MNKMNKKTKIYKAKGGASASARANPRSKRKPSNSPSNNNNNPNSNNNPNPKTKRSNKGVKINRIDETIFKIINNKNSIVEKIDIIEGKSLYGEGKYYYENLKSKTPSTLNKIQRQILTILQAEETAMNLTQAFAKLQTRQTRNRSRNRRGNRSRSRTPEEIN
jgi:hypothetical protein